MLSRTLIEATELRGRYAIRLNWELRIPGVLNFDRPVRQTSALTTLYSEEQQLIRGLLAVEGIESITVRAYSIEFTKGYFFDLMEMAPKIEGVFSTICPALLSEIRLRTDEVLLLDHAVAALTGLKELWQEADHGPAYMDFLSVCRGWRDDINPLYAERLQQAGLVQEVLGAGGASYRVHDVARKVFLALNRGDSEALYPSPVR